MQAVREIRLAPGRGQHALADHVPRTVEALLAGLEHEHHVTGQFCLARGQQFRGTDQTGRVQIVTAGVHHAVMLGREVLAATFGDG